MNMQGASIALVIFKHFYSVFAVFEAVHTGTSIVSFKILKTHLLKKVGKMIFMDIFPKNDRLCGIKGFRFFCEGCTHRRSRRWSVTRLVDSSQYPKRERW